MDKTRDEMNGNQRMLLSYLEVLSPGDDVLVGISEFLSDRSAPKVIYDALDRLSNAEITNVLHELTRPF